MRKLLIIPIITLMGCSNNEINLPVRITGKECQVGSDKATYTVRDVKGNKKEFMDLCEKYNIGEIIK